MNLFNLNTTFYNELARLDKSCGYAAFREKYMTFPPPGPLPSPPNQYGNVSGCDLWDAVDAAATLVNPCFDVYQVATTYVCKEQNRIRKAFCISAIESTLNLTCLSLSQPENHYLLHSLFAIVLLSFFCCHLLPIPLTISHYHFRSHRIRSTPPRSQASVGTLA